MFLKQNVFIYIIIAQWTPFFYAPPIRPFSDGIGWFDLTYQNWKKYLFSSVVDISNSVTLNSSQQTHYDGSDIIIHYISVIASQATVTGLFFTTQFRKNNGNI